MPLPIPVLDDRRFDDLVDEARALIPTHAPGWTNHNPSDPGITLIELFAYLTEALIYRLDQITPDNVCAFLDLLDWNVEHKPLGSTIPARGAGERPVRTVHDLDEEVRETVLALRRLDRAVTAEDYEQLARRPEAVRAAGLPGKVRPLRCFPGWDLRQNPPVEKPDHVSLVVLLGAGAAGRVKEAAEDIEAYLEPRRMLGAQFHVVAPVPLPMTITISVPAGRRELPEEVTKAVNEWLSPLTGGADHQGWPLGRSVYLSALQVFVASLPGVADVREIALTCEQPARILRDEKHGHAPSVVGVHLEPYEMPNAVVRVNLAAPRP